ncbi:MAG: cytochrome c biogenesis protein ResB [Clostridia bacterium]|nr:cytochrome c biogenesis protein ResB [Clostridia bacterium]
MTVYASAQGQNADYPIVSAVVFVFLGGALAVSVVAFNPQKSIYDIGFYLLHVGIVIFISGMIIFAVRGSSHYVALPDLSSVTEEVENQMKSTYGWSDKDIDRLRSYRNQIAGENGEIIDLGFNFRITDFDTEYYEDDKSVKHYEASLEFFLNDGTIETESLTVNHPIYRGGLKIYLMNVGLSPYGYEQVNLLIKNDPAEFLSVAGIILTILGTFMMCLLPKQMSYFRKKASKGEVTPNE